MAIPPIRPLTPPRRPLTPTTAPARPLVQQPARPLVQQPPRPPVQQPPRPPAAAVPAAAPVEPKQPLLPKTKPKPIPMKQPQVPQQPDAKPPQTPKPPVQQPVEKPPQAPKQPEAASPLVVQDTKHGDVKVLHTVDEFDKDVDAPRPVAALVAEAFPAPPARETTMTQDAQLQAILVALQKAVERRSKQDARSAAEAVIARTQSMPNGNAAIGVLPPAALRAFFAAITLGYSIETPSSSKPKNLTASDALGLRDISSSLGMSDDDDDYSCDLSIF